MAGAQLCAQFDLNEGAKEQVSAELAPRLRKLIAVLRAKRRRSSRGGFRFAVSFREKAIASESQACIRAQAQKISDVEEQVVAARVEATQVERAASQVE